MSKKAFEKVVTDYGKTELRFTNYYKYTFYYEGIAEDGKVVKAQNFGYSTYIYRAEVTATMTLKKLCEELPVNYISVGGKEYCTVV